MSHQVNVYTRIGMPHCLTMYRNKANQSSPVLDFEPMVKHELEAKGRIHLAQSSQSSRWSMWKRLKKLQIQVIEPNIRPPYCVAVTLSL